MLSKLTQQQVKHKGVECEAEIVNEVSGLISEKYLASALISNCREGTQSFLMFLLALRNLPINIVKTMTFLISTLKSLKCCLILIKTIT